MSFSSSSSAQATHAQTEASSSASMSPQLNRAAELAQPASEQAPLTAQEKALQWLLQNQLGSLLEQLARFNQWVQQPACQGPLQRHFQQQSERLFAQVWQFRQRWLQLGSSPDAAALGGEGLLPSQSLQGLSEALFNLQQKLTQLEQQLQQFAPLCLRPEHTTLLKQLAPLSLLSGIEERRLLVSAQSKTSPGLSIPKVLCETVRPLNVTNVLAWPASLSQSLHQLFKQQIALWVESPARIDPLRTEPLEAGPSWSAVIPHLLSLRLVGPAYYQYFVAKQLESRSFDALAQLEPMLFFALNYFNCNEPRLVLLHEQVEKLLAYLATPAQPYPSASTETQQQLVALVEHAVPSKLAYSPLPANALALLRQRLQNQTLLSALPNTDWQRINLEGTEDPSALYAVLAQLGERPVKAQHLLFAASLHQQENWQTLPKRLLLDCPTLELAQLAFAQWAQTLCALDERLIKSLETAEVHRSLLQSAGVQSSPTYSNAAAHGGAVQAKASTAFTSAPASFIEPLTSRKVTEALEEEPSRGAQTKRSAKVSDGPNEEEAPGHIHSEALQKEDACLS
jgi:hypothetical protein